MRLAAQTAPWNTLTYEEVPTNVKKADPGGGRTGSNPFPLDMTGQAGRRVSSALPRSFIRAVDEKRILVAICSSGRTVLNRTAPVTTCNSRSAVPREAADRPGGHSSRRNTTSLPNSKRTISSTKTENRKRPTRTLARGSACGDGSIRAHVHHKSEPAGGGGVGGGGGGTPPGGFQANLPRLGRRPASGTKHAAGRQPGCK